MDKDDLFNERPAMQGRDPFWILVALFSLTILATHCLELVLAQDYLRDSIGEHWKYVYSIANDCRELAFVGMFVLVIWFRTNRTWAFCTVLLLGLANCTENNFLCLALFGVLRTRLDWSDWATIDSSMAVIAAIITMPIVKWLTGSKRVFTRSLSIADFMLLTLAFAVLVTATSHLDDWSLFPDPGGITETLIVSGLLSVIGVSVVYVAYFDRLISGVGIYLLTWIVYIGCVMVTGFSQFKPSIDFETWILEEIWHGGFDHFIPVFAWFLLCILIARLVSRHMEQIGNKSESRSLADDA